MKEVTTLIGAAVRILEEAAKLENEENFVAIIRNFPLTSCPDSIIKKEIEKESGFINIARVLTLQKELSRRESLGIRIEEIKR